MSSKIIKIIIGIIVVAALGGAGYYWYFYVQSPTLDENGDVVSPFEFSPFGRPPVATQPTTQNPITEPEQETPITTNEPLKAPKLRLLSSTPVAGVSASSTASSTVIRFIDKGTGHIYETTDITSEVKKISNTTLPKIYESYWNKNLNSFVLRYLRDESDTVSNFYAELKSTGTSTTETPYEIKGRYLSPDINQVAVSPSGDKIFTWNIENGRGAGYTSMLDEKTKIRVAENPITQVVADWPEVNTTTIATKASGSASGYFYGIDIKTGIMSKLVGGFIGLTAKLNKDATKVLYSTGGKSIKTFYTSTKDGSTQEILFKTISDKCIWSNLRKNEVFCAVPTEIPSALYPDDWYKGSVSFIDQIWHLDTTTEEVHLLANLLDLSNKLIDATDLTLDPKEDFLYFINKRDLSLWSLDLNQ